MSANKMRGGGGSGRGGAPNVRADDSGTPPRFIVREIDGVPIGGYYARRSDTPMLSVSILDSAYCYREVARFNEEHERRAGRTKHAVREAMRSRAAGLAAMLEADHA